MTNDKNKKTTAHFDSEIAAQQRASERVSWRCCQGCLFHLAQAWYRKLASLGFQDTYLKATSGAAVWLKTCFGLSCLPINEVTEFFVNELGKAAPSQPLLQDFISYLNTIYLKPNSTFPPAMWAGCLDGSLQNTTNGCENFHRHFGTGCLTPHPSIYDWLYHVCLSHRRHMIKSKGENPPNKKSNALH